MPTKEARRLATLRALQLMDAPPSEPLLVLTKTIQRLMGVSFAGIALVDEDTVYLKSGCSGGSREVPRPISFATLVLEEDQLVEIEDVQHHASHGTLLSNRWLRFWAGTPVRSVNGRAIGVLEIAGPQPRTLKADEREALDQFALVAGALLRLQAVDQVFRPEDRPILSDKVLLERMSSRWSQLAAAFGIEDLDRVPPEPLTRWAQYDPAMFKLLLRKGTVPILERLQLESWVRFKDLLQDIPKMNQRTLTTRLRELESSGLIARKAYNEIPPRVEYAIPEDAKLLVQRLLQLTTGDPPTSEAANRNPSLAEET